MSRGLQSRVLVTKVSKEERNQRESHWTEEDIELQNNCHQGLIYSTRSSRNELALHCPTWRYREEAAVSLHSQSLGLQIWARQIPAAEVILEVTLAVISEQNTLSATGSVCLGARVGIIISCDSTSCHPYKTATWALWAKAQFYLLVLTVLNFYFVMLVYIFVPEC